MREMHVQSCIRRTPRCALLLLASLSEVVRLDQMYYAMDMCAWVDDWVFFERARGRQGIVRWLCKRSCVNVFQNAEQKQLYEKAAAEVKELEERLRGNDDDILYAKSHNEGLQREIED